MKRRIDGNRVSRWIFVISLLSVLVGMPWLASADDVLTTRWPVVPLEGEGNYDVVADGVGTFETTSGTFTVDVPGTPVVAFLYWAGLELDGDPGDDTVDVTVNTNPPETRTADDTYGPDDWVGAENHFVFVEDVTSMIETGANNITVADMTMFENYGVAVIVVYEDPSLPLVSVEIKDGLDSLFWDFAPPRGPNGEVNCFEFLPAAVDRVMEFNIVAGGVSVTTVRPNALWVMTGVAPNPGALPTNLIDEPGAFQIGHSIDPYPFDSHNGNQIDILPSDDTDIGQQFGGVVIPAGDNFACLQAESIRPDDPDNPAGLNGASMIWIALAGKIIQPAPPLAALGDFVWLDGNQNGIQDAGEPGVSGVTVNLFDGAGTLVSSTTTDANGFYLFDNLTPGDYFVEFIPPSGFKRSPQDQGQNDGADSDADPATGRTMLTNLAAGERDLTWDAGIFQPATATPTSTVTATWTPTGTISITPTIIPTGSITPATATPSLALDPVCIFRGSLQGVPGQVAVWQLTVSNPGTVPMPDIVVTDSADPASVAEIVTAATTKGTYTISSLTVTFNIGTLAPGESAEMTITARFRDDLTGPVGNRPVARSNPRADVNCVTGLPNTGYLPSTQTPQSQSSPLRMPLVVGAVVTAVGGLVLWRRRRMR